MKKLLSLILMFIMTLVVKSQDIPPSPLTFTYKVNGVTKTNEPLKREYFQQTNFVLGTQWYGHPRMLQALKMQVQQGTQPDGTGAPILPNPDSLTYKMYHIWDYRDYDEALGFEFKPTLYIPEADRGKFITNLSDPSRPVFGFSHRNGTVVSPSDSGDINYRLGLFPGSMGSYSSDSVVLKKAWLNNKHIYNDKSPDTLKNGKQWIFSINLRRLNLSENANPNDTILTIRLPYSLVVSPTSTTTGTIKFSEIPVNDRNNHTNLNYREDRGKALNRITAPANTTTLAITYGMLPDNTFYATYSKKDITINAYFICDGLPANNPLIQTKDGQNGLDTIDVQVKYHGKVSVGINFLRIISPYGYDFITGKWDNAYKNTLQSTINDAESKGYEIFGFYGRDEFPEHYFTEKHYNSYLMNYCTVSEGAGGEHFDHYRHYVEPMNVWTGALNTKHNQATPFFSKEYHGTDNQIQLYRLNYPRRSYQGWYSDTLNSCYETDLDTNVYVEWNFGQPIWSNIRIKDIDSMTLWPKWSPPTNILTGLEAYKYGIYFPSTFQGFIENKTYDAFYKNRDYLYSGENWWGHNYPMGNWGVTNGYAHIGNTRPQTGEEVRYFLWVNLAMGCKGLMYDARCDSLRHDSGNDSGGFLNNEHQRDTYDTWDLDSLVFTDNSRIGGDFIPAIDSSMFIHKFINRDSTAKYLGVDTNRIYYGRKSPRIEMYNIHKWIRANDSLLMNLRLVSAFSKGYRIWRHADTARFVDTIMNKYIQLDDRPIIFHPLDSNITLVSDIGVLTRPIGRFFDSSPWYEPYDSSFFDIGLHRLSSDTNLNSNIIIMAVLNRRTDPLVYFTEDENDKHILFMNPSEYYQRCDSGGVNPLRPNGPVYSDTVWQKYYAQQLGAREIAIPFAVIDSTKDIYYRIEELTDGTEFADNLPWWKQEEIRNRVMVTIPQGNLFSANYSPGQGRMYKVTIVYDDTSPIVGELAFSNQTKIVAYPANQNSNYDFVKDSATQVLNFYKDDLMYYHIVYDREYTQGKSRVYYRRSAVPYNREHNTKIINWGPELLVSDTIKFTKTYLMPELFTDYIYSRAGVNISCKYPSIVVRYNSDSNKVYTYIVFSCSSPAVAVNSKIFLVECAFPQDQTLNQSSIPDTLEPIDFGWTGSLNDDQIDKWGGPSINASYSGNYYAFSDSLYGLGVGFKTPGDRGKLTNNKKYIKYNYLASECTQPSLNTYSRMNINEENCALVYKEYRNSNSSIIYTRLHNPNGQIDNYAPSAFCTSDPLDQTALYGYDWKTARINYWDVPTARFNAEYPAVYRPVEFARRPGYEEADSLHYVGACWDRVYWQANVTTVSGDKSIFMKNIDIDDTQDCWYLLPELRLYSPMANISHASPGPGAPSSKTDGFFGELALADSSFVLNFIKYPLSQSPTYTNSDVYQINHHGWFNSFERWSNSDPYDDHEAVTIFVDNIGNGIYPQTTHTPVITKNSDWYIHSRIFETTDTNIITRSKLFLKGQTDEKTIYPMLSLSDSTKNAQMSEIYMVDNQKSIGLNAFDSPEPGRIKAVDTIFSDWFRVDEIKELGFFSIVGDTSLYRMELESSKGKIDIPVRKDYSKFLTSRKITLLNGKNNLYRIKLIKRNKDINVWVDLLFDTKRDLADMSNDTRDLNKSASQDNTNHQIIDLGSGGLSADMDLRIFPNPANDFIYATGELLGSENQLIVYTLYNTAGLEVFKSEGISGQPIMIPTSDLTTGAYFLKAEQKFNEDYEIKHIISKSVIIQR